MYKQKILICEDDEDCIRILDRILTNGGYLVIQTTDGEEALNKISKSKPDLIILDLNLPDTDGLFLCKQLKSEKSTQSIPIIMLTVRSSETDTVVGLESGADDYIPKPIRPAIVIARVRALLRRFAADLEENKILTSGNLSLNTETRKCFIKKTEILLRPKEFDLLLFLMRNPGKALSRPYITESVWGFEYFGTTRTVDTTIYNLKKQLGAEAEKIKAVPPIGYQFVD